FDALLHPLLNRRLFLGDPLFDLFLYVAARFLIGATDEGGHELTGQRRLAKFRCLDPASESATIDLVKTPCGRQVAVLDDPFRRDNPPIVAMAGKLVRLGWVLQFRLPVRAADLDLEAM